LKLIFANQLSELNLTTVTVLAIVGLVFYLAEKRFFLPAWLFVIFISEPRSAPLFMSPVVAIFAAHALMRLLEYLNSLIQKTPGKVDLEGLLSSGWAKILFAFFFAQWMFSAFATVINLSNAYFLSNAEENAYKWISENTPEESRFIVLSGLAPLTDPISEWMPAISKRISLGTVQGYEWVGNENFNDILEEASALQNCYAQSPECLLSWLDRNNKSADYILIDNHLLEQSSQDEFPVYPSALIEILSDSQAFIPVYDADGVVIFRISEN
jgi:hypothetical protein